MMAKQYEVYVQGKYYKTFETDNSMSLVWEMTNLLATATVHTEIPWYDSKKPDHIKVVPEDYDVDVKGESTPDAD
jgi:hypothetical protein